MSYGDRRNPLNQLWRQNTMASSRQTPRVGVSLAQGYAALSCLFSSTKPVARLHRLVSERVQIGDIAMGERRARIPNTHRPAFFVRPPKNWTPEQRLDGFELMEANDSFTSYFLAVSPQHQRLTLVDFLDPKSLVSASFALTDVLKNIAPFGIIPLCPKSSPRGGVFFTWAVRDDLQQLEGFCGVEIASFELPLLSLSSPSTKEPWACK